MTEQEDVVITTTTTTQHHSGDSNNNFDDDLITWSIDFDNDDDENNDFEIDNNKGMIFDLYKYQNSNNKQQQPIITINQNEFDSINTIKDNNNLLQEQTTGGGCGLSSPSMDIMNNTTKINQFIFPRNSSIASFINNKETTSNLKRLGSFYFSVASDRGSITDLLSLVDEQTNNGSSIDHTNDCHNSYQEEEKSSSKNRYDENEIKTTPTTTSSTVQSNNNTSSTSLFHDILMNILTFVDFDSLGSFSEAGRRPNGECYYYIHLQLCKVISSCDNNNNINNQLTTKSNVTNKSNDYDNKDKCYLPNWSLLRRYILLDEKSAIEMIHKVYYDAPENQMKFRNHNQIMIRNKLAAAAAAASSAAAFMLFMGTMMAYQNGHVELPDEYEEYVNAFTSLFKVMGVVGSIAAAKTMADNKHNNTGTNNSTSSATAYDIQHSLWERLIENMIPNTNTTNTTTPTGFSFGRQCKYAMMMAYSMATERLHQFQTSNNTNRNKENSSNTDDGNGNNNISSDAALSPISFLTEDFPLLWTNNQRLDPYIHISDTFDSMEAVNKIATQTSSMENNDDPKTQVTTNTTTSSSNINNNSNNNNEQPTSSSSSLQKDESKKWYCGCIGAYRQLVHAIRLEITSTIKQDRVRKYQSLTVIEKDLISSSFMDAIVRNDTNRVKELIHTIDIDICYSMNEDNTTMMYPLHAAAFHGADKVLEFLCNGIDDNDNDMDNSCEQKYYNDGGLIGNINQQQELTGWTALHFAVGGNNMNAVRILLHANVDPTIEADSGYTPFQWAQRLQNHDVVNEFKLFYSYQHQQQLNQLRTAAAANRNNNYFNRYR